MNLLSGIWLDIDSFFENQFLLFVWHKKSQTIETPITNNKDQELINQTLTLSRPVNGSNLDQIRKNLI